MREAEREALKRGVAPKRYERNIGSLGLEGQARLLDARVVVVGLGGLGGHLVEMLARLGVGRIAGIDDDVFDETNLNRQVFSDMDNLGRPKAEVIRERLARINPAVEFMAHVARFESLSEDVFKGCSVVFDCLDRIPSRLELERRCAAAKVPLVHGAIAGLCGRVAVCPPGAGTLEKIYADKTLERGMEVELGNLPMTAAAAADLMAALALPSLLGKPVKPVLRFFDLCDGAL